MELSESPVQQKKRMIPWYGWGAIFVVDFILIISLVVYIYTRPPSQFPVGIVTIEQGLSVIEIADQLEEMNVVESSRILQILLLLETRNPTIQSGNYTFNEAVSTWEVANVLLKTIPTDTLLSVTFPEGFVVSDFDVYLPDEITIDTPLVAAAEGELFPDTYLVPETYTKSELVALLKRTQEERLRPLTAEIESSSFTEAEIINLASIIEREANDETSMRLVSGILQNRLAIGMALQVDASVAYGLDKSGTELTRADLTTDGPYNTYTRSGLPPTPISNPGLESITAVLNPTPSEYLFYITGNDGNFYYAETLEQHNLNIARYLR